MKKPGTYKDWKRIGDDTKVIHRRLGYLLVNPEYQELLTKYEQDSLYRALDHLERFKVRAEDRMFRLVNPPRSEDQKWFAVFYGGQRKEVGTND